MSVNVFSESLENLAERRMVEIGVPPSLQPSFGLSGTQRLELASVWLRHLVCQTTGGDAAAGDDRPGAVGHAAPPAMERAAAASKAFLAPQLSSRWSGLYRRLGCAEWSAQHCPKQADPNGPDGLPAAAREEAVAHASGIASALHGQLSQLGADATMVHVDSIRALLLIRYVERLVRHIMGDGDGSQICPMLRCVAEPTAWS